MLQALSWAALGTGFTFLMTTLGAAVVFFFVEEPRPQFQRTMLGFAAGVMTAASVWSLLLPAIEQSADFGVPGWLPAAAGLLLAAVWLVFPGLFRRLPRWLRRTVCVVLVAGLLALGTILTLMGIRAAHHPDGTQPVTVIVLGCQVRSDGTPSRMLRDRIQAAYDYLSIHEEAVCVASGGQNNQEPTTEARCIRDTLVSMGIAPGRIYLEDASISTEENLAFSAEVIRREGLPTEVAIASDNFHQLRAGVWAEKDGLTPYSLGCASIWMLGPGYWAREAAALLYMGATGAL